MWHSNMHGYAVPTQAWACMNGGLAREDLHMPPPAALGIVLGIISRSVWIRTGVLTCIYSGTCRKEELRGVDLFLGPC